MKQLFKNNLSKVSVLTALAVISNNISAAAKVKDMSSLLSQTENFFTGNVAGIINIILILLGLIGAVLVLWAYLQTKSGRGEGNGKLAETGGSLLLAAAMIFLIKTLFLL